MGKNSDKLSKVANRILEERSKVTLDLKPLKKRHPCPEQARNERKAIQRLQRKKPEKQRKQNASQAMRREEDEKGGEGAVWV